MTRDEYINGLRAVADWLEAHPDVPHPQYSGGITVTSAGLDDVSGEAWLRRAAESAGIPAVTSDHRISISITPSPGITYEVMHIWESVSRRYQLVQDLGERAAEAVGVAR